MIHQFYYLPSQKSMLASMTCNQLEETKSIMSKYSIESFPCIISFSSSYRTGQTCAFICTRACRTWELGAIICNSLSFLVHNYIEHIFFFFESFHFFVRRAFISLNYQFLSTTIINVLQSPQKPPSSISQVSENHLRDARIRQNNNLFYEPVLFTNVPETSHLTSLEFLIKSSSQPCQLELGATQVALVQ